MPATTPDLMLWSLEVFDERTGKSAFGLLLPAIKLHATGGGGGAGIVGARWMR